MNKFITRLSGFLLSLIALFLMNGIINYALYTNTSCGIKKSNFLITGDSHLQQALDPTSFSDAINISQPGEPLPLTYWKVKEILQIYTPDTLIIGFGPHNLSTFQDYKFSHDPWAQEMITRSYPIQDFNSFKNIKIDYPTYIKVLWKETGFYPTWNHCEYIGSYSTVTKNDLSQINQRIQQHYYYNGTEVGVSSTAISYLNKLVNLCRSYDLTLVIASSPVHPKYYKGIPSNLKEKYYSVIKHMKSNGIEVIDKTNKFYPDTLYKNADHLNQLGAKRFTDEVKKIIAG